MVRSEISIPDDEIFVFLYDSVFGTDSPIDISNFSSYIQELGVKVGIEKTHTSKVGQPLSFLGSDWHNGLPHRNLRELVIRVTYPENIVRSMVLDMKLSCSVIYQLV